MVRFQRFICQTSIALSGLLAVSARAQPVLDWTGSASDRLSIDGNWSPAQAPAADADLHFGIAFYNAGHAGFSSPVNDLTGFVGHHITWDHITAASDGSFTITGNGMTLAEVANPVAGTVAQPRIDPAAAAESRRHADAGW